MIMNLITLLRVSNQMETQKALKVSKKTDYLLKNNLTK